jgi:hypothetical protein
MKNSLITLIALLLLGCGSKDLQVKDALISILNESTDKQEQYKACILLAELPADDELIDMIDGDSDQVNFCKTFLLAKYLVSQEIIDQFISAFPLNNQLLTLFVKHSETGYIFGILPPAVKLLSEFARDNDQALDKLMEILTTADGAYGESITEVLADIYMRMPSRVELSFKRVKPSESDILLIKKTSDYKRNL